MEVSTKQKLALCFVASGFSSLVCQVVWTRLAMAHFGVITPVMSVVLSAFMLGLALGSWTAGRWASRTPNQTPASFLRLYGLSELVIGCGAVTVPFLFRLGETWLLSVGAGMDSGSYLALASIFILVSLFPWCFAMGVTFPLMMAAMRSARKTQDSFSFLYLANVAGAVLGTLLSALVLIELTGFKGTLMLAGVVNTGVFLFCWTQSRTLRWSERDMLSSSSRPVERTSDAPISSFLLGFILFLTGFTSMGLEVVWVRNFTPVLATTIYAFASIVALYLIATALGSFRYRHDRGAGTVLSLPNLLAAILLSVTLPILLSDPRARLGFLGVLVTLIPFCAVLGYLTPYLIDRGSAGDPDRAGSLYAINTLGCVLGPLVASYLLLAYSGVKWSLVLFALPYGLLFLWVIRGSFGRMHRVVAVAAGACLLTVGLAGKSYEERYPEGVVRRDYAATVISLGEGLGKRMLVNGVGITSLDSITKLMAHMPMLALPGRPSSALVICLGMGTTYRALLTWNIDVTAVELVPSVVDAFPYYFNDAEVVRNNPRGKIVVDDGRRYLQRTRDTFDVVTLDPPPPFEAAGSSLLYSEEFYELVKSRLKPKGVLQQWLPAFTQSEISAVTRSLKQAFPYVRAFRAPITGISFLASRHPIVIPPLPQAIARMPPAARKDLVEWESVDTGTFLKRFLAREVEVESLLQPENRVMMTDNRPYNEYYFLRRIPVRFGLKHKGET